MGKGGQNIKEFKGRKISLEELSKHRTASDGKILSIETAQFPMT